MSPRFVGLRRPQAGSFISYTNGSPADRHGFGYSRRQALDLTARLHAARSVRNVRDLAWPVAKYVRR